MFTQAEQTVSNRLLLFLTIVFFLVAFLALTAFPAPAAPTITWSPSSVEVTVAPGESETIPVFFTVSKTIENVVVRVFPELEPYVTTSPGSFVAIGKGETKTFNLTFSAPATALPGTFEGIIQLRSATPPKKNFAKPLPVAIVITWATAENGGVALDYPPTWEVAILEGTQDQLPLLAFTSPGGSRLVVLPEGGLEYGIGLGATFTQTSLVLDGRPAVRVDYRGLDDRLFLVRVGFDPKLPELPDFHIEFRPTPGDSDAVEILETILETLRLE